MSVRHPQEIYVERLEGALTGGRRWLDVGCGRRLVPARFERRVALESRREGAALAVGVDRDLVALAEHRSGLDLVRASGDRLPFADASFDLVSSNMVFEHLERPLAVLGEIRRVLRSGGWLLLHTPNAFDLVTLGARALPNRWHPRIVAWLERRPAADVYPTYFRFNRRGTIESGLRAAGFGPWRIEALDQPDDYGAVPGLASLERLWHRGARRLPWLRGTLLIEAEAS